MPGRATLIKITGTLIVIFALAMPVSARASDPSAFKPTTEQVNRFAHLMTYEELWRLSPDLREAYISGVRETLIDFEELLKSRGQMTADAKRLSAKLLIFQTWLEEAEAVNVPNSPFLRRRPIDRAGIDAFARLQKCPTRFTNNKKVAPLIAEGLVVACPLSSMGCPRGYKQNGAYGKNLVCANFDQIYAKAKKEKLALNARKARQAAAASAKAKSKLKSASAKEVSVEAAHDGHETASASSADEATVSPEDQASSNLVVEADHAARAIEDGVKLNAASGQTVLENEEDGKTSCVALPAHPDPTTCKAKTVEEAKARFISAGNKTPHCIYAGNVSHFKNMSKKPGNCQAPQEFCLGNLTCRDAAGNKRLDQPPTYKCGAGEVICNPYVFDLGQDDKALCVSKTANATEACAAKADLVNHQTSFMFRLKTEEGKERNLTGIQGGWDDFATSMNDMCFDDKDASEYFCSECHFIKLRLTKLRLAANRYDPTVGPQQCSRMFELKSINQPSTSPRPPAAAGSVN